MQNARRHTPTLQDASREEIQALIETPEMRRIFSERAPRTGKHSGRKGGSKDRESGQPAPAASPRRSVGRRIAVGLVPVYLAMPIILYEAGPDAISLPDLLRTSADQTIPGATAEAAAALTAPVAARTAAADPEGAASVAGGAGTSERVAFAKRGAPPDAAAAAGQSPGGIERKSAADIGKQASRDGVAPLQTPAGPDEGMSGDATASADLAAAEWEAEAQPVSGPYPDPREGLANGLVAPDLEQAAATEEAMRLSRRDRREIQRRLRLAEFEPQLVDGIFGPATRAALEAWQASAGIPATGYVDEASMALLVEQTAEEYRAWRAAERARERREAEQSAVVATSAPPASMSRTEECRRSGAGDIAYGQGMRCDVRGLREDFRSDFSKLKGELRQLFR